MSWIKRIQPITLSQSSDLPFVVLENGLYLCFDNFYESSKQNPRDNSMFLRFTANKHELLRRASSHYRFLKFPTIVPFECILEYDRIIVDGHVTKTEIEPSNEIKHILVISAEWFDDSTSDQRDHISDLSDQSDKTFLLINQLSAIKNKMETAETIHHNNDWGRVCVSIFDKMCDRPDRGFGWTNSLPEINLSFYGLSDATEMEHIQSIIDFLDIQNCSATWEQVDED